MTPPRSRLRRLLFDLIPAHHATHRTDTAWSICPDLLCRETAEAVGLRSANRESNQGMSA